MEALGVASGHPEESCHRVFGGFAQAGSGTPPAPFPQMLNDVLSLCLRDLGVEQRGATSLGELLATGTATEESDIVLVIDFAHGEIALTCETKLLACGIDTRESVEVGSFHPVLWRTVGHCLEAVSQLS
jgi:hypothetical protein